MRVVLVDSARYVVVHLVEVGPPATRLPHQVDERRCDACGFRFCGSCDGQPGNPCICGPCTRRGHREAA